jgi:hypothetical protein
MPFEVWLHSLSEDSIRHVRDDLAHLNTAPRPFLTDDQVVYQIEQLSMHLGSQPARIRQAAIEYSLYVRQLDAIQEQNGAIHRICAGSCPRPPVGCCNGEHHVILSLSDIVFSRPSQNALQLAHVLTGMQNREHSYAVQQGRLPRPDYCSHLTSTGCTLRMFKSPRCIHYLCPHVAGAITAAHGDQASAFLGAMHATGNQVIRGIEDFTSALVIRTAETLFHQ